MSVLILDTETTDRDAPEVIEVAWLRLEAGPLPAGEPPRLSPVVVDRFCQRYRPEKAISFGALAVHHILPSELEGCPPSSSFALPPGTEYLVGHSIDFDWGAIGKPEVKRIDTHVMAQHLWPHADSHSQSALLYLLLGPSPDTRERLRGAHGAAVDVANNLTLLERILAEKPEITTWSALWEFSELARIPTVMPMGRNRGAPISSLETSEIYWYLDRDFIDAYLRKAFTQEVDRRRAEASTADEACEEDDDVRF